MADFEALNEQRSETLRQIREMVREEAALWTRYFNGHNTAEMVAHIERNRARFRELWDQHEEVRRQMVDAGLIPPPAQPDELFGRPLEDPARHKIEDGLKEEMEAARAEYYCASQEFRLFVVQGTAPCGASTLIWWMENCPKSRSCPQPQLPSRQRVYTTLRYRA